MNTNEKQRGPIKSFQHNYLYSLYDFSHLAITIDEVQPNYCWLAVQRFFSLHAIFHVRFLRPTFRLHGYARVSCPRACIFPAIHLWKFLFVRVNNSWTGRHMRVHMSVWIPSGLTLIRLENNQGFPGVKNETTNQCTVLHKEQTGCTDWDSYL